MNKLQYEIMMVISALY